MKEKLKNLLIKFKIESYKIKEHAKNKPSTPLHDKLFKAIFIVSLVLYIFVGIFSCSIKASAQEELTDCVKLAADEPTEDDQVIIPSGWYIPRYQTLTDYSHIYGTYILHDVYSYSAVAINVVSPTQGTLELKTDYSIPIRSIYISDDAVSGICDSITTDYTPIGQIAFTYTPDLGYNSLLYRLFSASNMGSISSIHLNAPFPVLPYFFVYSDNSVSGDFGEWFLDNFQNITQSGGSTLPQECPTVEELLADMSGQDALQALYNSNSDATMIIAQAAVDAYNNGKTEGLTEGYNTGYEQAIELSHKFSGNFFTDIVGNVMDALDGLVIYEDSFVTVSLLTIIRSLLAFFAIIWILKLVAGG